MNYDVAQVVNNVKCDKQILNLTTGRLYFGLGNDRFGVLAAGPEMAGYRSIFRFVGYFRTWTGC